MRRKAATSEAVTTPSALAILADNAMSAAEKAASRRATGSPKRASTPPLQASAPASAPTPPCRRSLAHFHVFMAPTYAKQRGQARHGDAQGRQPADDLPGDQPAGTGDDEQ